MKFSFFEACAGSGKWPCRLEAGYRSSRRQASLEKGLDVITGVLELIEMYGTTVSKIVKMD